MNTKDLKKRVYLAKRLAGKSSLMLAWIEQKNLWATDLETTVCWPLGGCKIDECRGIRVNQLYERVSALAKHRDEVLITYEGLEAEGLTVSVDLYDDFDKEHPLTPELNEMNGASLTIEELRRALEGTKDAVEGDQTRPVLTALHIADEGKGRARFEATDGERAHQVWTPSGGALDGALLSNVDILLRVVKLQDSDDVVSVMRGVEHFNNEERYWLVFSFGGGTMLWQREVEGKFPDLSQVYKDPPPEGALRIAKDDLSAAVSIVSTASDAGQAVLGRAPEGGLRVWFDDTEAKIYNVRGEIPERPTVITGELILDALAQCTSDTVDFYWLPDDVTTIEDGDFRAIIAPCVMLEEGWLKQGIDPVWLEEESDTDE